MNLCSLILILHWNNLTDFNAFIFDLYYSVEKKGAMCLSAISTKVNSYPWKIHIDKSEYMFKHNNLYPCTNDFTYFEQREIFFKSDNNYAVFHIFVKHVFLLKFSIPWANNNHLIWFPG